MSLKTGRPRVVYWNNIPAPYMVERFNVLARRGNLDLEAWFGARNEPDRSWAIDESDWQFRFRYLPRVGVGQRRLTLPSATLTRRRVDLLVSLYSTPSFLVGLQIGWWRGWRTALWAPITFDSWVRRYKWKEALKKEVFRRSDAIITAGHDGRGYALRYGAEAARIHIVRHAVDTRFFSSAGRAAREHRDEIRKRLGVSGVVFLYVGRLWRGKGIDCLLDAYERVSAALPGSTHLLMVGDGPDEPAIRRRITSRGLHVTLTGFSPRSDLPSFYAASDVFVFPTLGDPYGLVADEAMASGLPVISTTAAGEIRERIQEGATGLLVPPGDAAALGEMMMKLAVNPGLRSAMGIQAAAAICPYTLDAWAASFEHAVEAIVALPPRGWVR